MTISDIHPRREARQCVLEALFAHQYNTFDKRKLLERPSKFVRQTPLKVENFIQEEKEKAR